MKKEAMDLKEQGRVCGRVGGREGSTESQVMLNMLKYTINASK